MDLRQRKLEAVAFDPDKDRLFSVGDLVSRGDSSPATLLLLNEPQFFSGQDHHKRMLCDYLFNQGPIDWIESDGVWCQNLAEDGVADAIRLARKAQRLPFMLVVGEGVNRFQIVHAELPDPDRFSEREWMAHGIEVATWSRKISKDSCMFQAYYSLTGPHAKQIENHGVEHSVHYKPIDSDWALTFSGNRMVERPMLWRSHYLFDTGSGGKGGVLTLVNVADVLAQYRHFKAKGCGASGQG